MVLILAVLAFLTVNSLFTLSRQGAIIEEMGVRDRAAIEAVDDFSNDVADFAQGFAAVLAGVLPPTVTAVRMQRNAEGIMESFDLLMSIVGTRIDAVAAAGARDMRARLPDLGERTRDAFARRQRDLYAPLQEEWLDMVVAFNRLSSDARAIAKADADLNLHRAHQLQEEGRLLNFIAAGVGVLSLGLIWFVLVVLTARPLGQLAASMQKLARGHADVEIPGADRADQVGEMARAVEVFKTNLGNTNRLMDQALEGARRTAVVTTQASQAIGQVSDGAMTQLAELRQVSDALGHTTEAVADVGRSTQRARDTASEAQSLLGESLEKVRQLIETVDAVGEDTERVTRIAATIAKIATQTNILAINAAIEAARAGEHGRGLAVVAEEVRALAANTEALAQEIADVVLAAGRRTREGAGTAAAVGEAMDDFERLTGESARLAAAIAVAMEEQQTTVASLDERVAVLTRIGQSNATAAEEITVTMIDLSRLASESRSAVESMAARSE
ncbi:methyl-accepting chemotaxis protein [Roseococcus pinisoli]|uniref:Methyl-accepting chemotaxis protein n=1 Tax=Roseococcus pinisoli TaxID=2835040 RepID=A0ABS5QFI4_9PROT|nr:methyl-accepting chemotaxis protein [Roseococcus pinisoli]MBS7812459.1 methyl-accepting chemotaxis protein [Roseococcus pinisoli]